MKSQTAFLAAHLTEPVVTSKAYYDSAKVVKALEFLEMRMFLDHGALNPLETLAVELIISIAGYASAKDLRMAYEAYLMAEKLRSEA